MTRSSRGARSRPDVGGWFDSHCHVQEEFTGDAAEESGPEVLSRAAESGVDRLVCIGTGVATSRQALELARSTSDASVGAGERAGAGAPRAWASVGLHPHEASEGVDGVAALLARALDAGRRHRRRGGRVRTRLLLRALATCRAA